MIILMKIVFWLVILVIGFMGVTFFLIGAGGLLASFFLFTEEKKEGIKVFLRSVVSLAIGAIIFWVIFVSVKGPNDIYPHDIYHPQKNYIISNSNIEETAKKEAVLKSQKSAKKYPVGEATVASKLREVTVGGRPLSSQYSEELRQVMTNHLDKILKDTEEEKEVEEFFEGIDFYLAVLTMQGHSISARKSVIKGLKELISSKLEGAECREISSVLNAYTDKLQGNLFPKWLKEYKNYLCKTKYTYQKGKILMCVKKGEITYSNHFANEEFAEAKKFIFSDEEEIKCSN